MRIALLTLGIITTLNSTIYPAAGVVTRVYEGGRYSDDVVYVTTATGVEYGTFSDDLAVGDIVTMIMDDNGTPDNIRDDIILGMRYSGLSYRP